MAQPNRPTRPGTTRSTSVRPATGKTAVPAQKPATSSGRGATTRSVARGATSRAPASARKSNTPLIIGGSVGGLVVLILIIAIASSGGSDAGSSNAPASKKKKVAAPVDVSALEREAESKCQEGLALIRKSESMMTGRQLSASEQARLKADLEKGIRLISEGNGLFEQAMEKSGNKYDTVKYNQAYKAARMKVGELGSK